MWPCHLDANAFYQKSLQVMLIIVRKLEARAYCACNQFPEHKWDVGYASFPKPLTALHHASVLISRRMSDLQEQLLQR